MKMFQKSEESRRTVSLINEPEDWIQNLKAQKSFFQQVKSSLFM